MVISIPNVIQSAVVFPDRGSYHALVLRAHYGWGNFRNGGSEPMALLQKNFCSVCWKWMYILSCAKTLVLIPDHQSGGER
jgi:hypothetical protein